jgi:uncharacterized NAD(P)/FAD-binding protein YdhS
MKQKVIIIGGGFSGTMVAIQMVKKGYGPLHIVIISDGEKLNRGVAFSAYSSNHLLNVKASHMSALPDQPFHFLDWAMKQPAYENIDRNVMSNAFLPRHVYGQYLTEMWQFANLQAIDKEITIEVKDDKVDKMIPYENGWQILLNSGNRENANHLVLATGNALPRHPSIANMDFYNESKNYFRNPWELASVEKPPLHLPVLILGNGLTMADTVIGLLEHGMEEKIISLSPNGFNLLQHRFSSIKYTKLLDEAFPGMGLHDWLRLINKHRKMIRNLGLSAAPIIDSLRPLAIDIWRGLTLEEKQIFMRRLRHFWGVARHRVPVQVHDLLIRLRLEQKLEIQSGNILDLLDGGDFVRVHFWNKKTQRKEKIDVSRVINCTGPEGDIARLENSFLKQCLTDGIIKQDPLKLGLEATWPELQVIGADGNPRVGLYAIGNLLRGVLWESTAVGELREQAVSIADSILKSMGTQNAEYNNFLEYYHK